MIPAQGDTDHDLICQLKEGSEQAFTVLFHRYQQKVYQFCLRFTHSSPIAQEWMQDAFIQVWLHRDTLNPFKSLSGYLLIIARNKAFDHIQKEKAGSKRVAEWVRQTVPSADMDSRFGSESAELERSLHTIITRLPAQRRKIYELREEGLSHKMIADQLGLSQGTVKHQIVLSLRTLRRFIMHHNR